MIFETSDIALGDCQEFSQSPVIDCELTLNVELCLHVESTINSTEIP